MKHKAIERFEKAVRDHEFAGAARVLMQLSEKLRQHAIERDNALAELSVEAKK